MAWPEYYSIFNEYMLWGFIQWHNSVFCFLLNSFASNSPNAFLTIVEYWVTSREVTHGFKISFLTGNTFFRFHHIYFKVMFFSSSALLCSYWHWHLPAIISMLCNPSAALHHQLDFSFSLQLGLAALNLLATPVNFVASVTPPYLFQVIHTYTI